MRPGSVIVDLAAEAGGNCELTEPGEEVVREGVTIVGLTNLPSTMPFHASQLLRAQRLRAAAPPRAGGDAGARLGRRDHRRRVRDPQGRRCPREPSRGRGAGAPRSLSTDRHELGTDPSQTRAPNPASVSAEGGGTVTPTLGGVSGSRVNKKRRRPPARRRRAMSHNTLLVFELTILVLAIFLGFEVISKVPTMLHTPLMSGTNAIHGIVDRRRDGRARRAAQGHVRLDRRLPRRRARLRERRRRLRRHRPHARDVQAARAARRSRRSRDGQHGA